MAPLSVTVVTRDPLVRAAAARAFDTAPADWTVELATSAPTGPGVVVFGPDIEGDPRGIRFDPAAPARVLDDIGRARHQDRGLVLVTSASRGTGVTTIALHLAAAFTRPGSPATLLDLDRSWGGASARLGIELPATPSSGPGLAPIPVRDGIRLIDGRVIDDPVAALGDPSVPGPVVVDLPPGEDGANIPALAQACVFVVSPTRPGVDRARRALEGAVPSLRLAVVTNRLGRGGDISPASLAHRLGRKILLELPCTPGLRDAEDEGRLLGSWSRWRSRIALLASALGTA